MMDYLGIGFILAALIGCYIASVRESVRRDRGRR